MNSRVNTRRADLDLPQFALPPAEPVFSPNPVAELAHRHLDSHLPAHRRLDGCPKSGPRPRPRPSRAVVAVPTAAGACLRTAAFRGAEIRNPNLETRNKLKFPIFQCPKLAAGQWFKSLSA